MAKAAAKKTTTKEAKKPTTSGEKASSNNIEKVMTDTFEKLKALGIDEQLQRDIQWCLGSYRADNNPVGLQDCGRKALTVLQVEKEKKTKGVTAKLIQDLEKVVKE
jgi:hypothetical protein